MALTNSQYQKIMRDYEITRDTNRHLSEVRREQVYSKIPEFRELDESVGSYAVRRVRMLLENDSDISSKTTDTDEPNPYTRIAVRRKALLRAAGFPEDYLDPIYTCPNCQDTGYITLESGLKEKCLCLRKQEISCLYEQANLQGILPNDNFSQLSYRYCQGDDLERLKGAVRISQDFVNSFGTPAGTNGSRNLLFYGTVGTGKSFLSGCIANALLEKGCSVVYFSAVGFFETLARYSFDSFEKETLYNYVKDLYNYDLVIVDDLGTELLSSFVTSQLFTFLNEREARGKSTIISTNLNLQELRDRYSDRIFSRLTKSYTICKLTGPDVRMCQKLGTK